MSLFTKNTADLEKVPVGAFQRPRESVFEIGVICLIVFLSENLHASEHCGASGYDPCGEHCGDESAHIYAAGLALEPGTQESEEDKLRRQQDQRRHKRSSERRAKQKIRAGSEPQKERDILNKDHDKEPAEQDEHIPHPTFDEVTDRLTFVSDLTHRSEQSEADIHNEEQCKERQIEQELPKSDPTELLEKRPDESEVKLEHRLTEDNHQIEICNCKGG